MSKHVLKKGLDLPIDGVADSRIDTPPFPKSVALVGSDYIELKPRMLVAEGDEVRRGSPLFCHKDNPDVLFTSPATGTVKEINRGARRVLESVVIEVQDEADAGLDFGAHDAGSLKSVTRDDAVAKLCVSGLWTSFLTRPYSKIPATDSVPAAIFVTAMDTEPLAADAAQIIADAREAFDAGLKVISKLSEGPTFLCQAPGDTVAGQHVDGIETHEFEGPHPAGLAGTHMHFLFPPTISRTVWSIGYQDVIAIGELFLTGHIEPRRIIALCGPRARAPRLLRTCLGAAILPIIEGEIEGDAACRVISGSVLTGRQAGGPLAYLGRYDRQITLITEDSEQLTFGWITPQPKKFALQPVLASAYGKAGRLFDLTTNLNGGRRAMVPLGTFENLMPQDFLPTQLLRALLVMDTDTAQSLGALELAEEDLALCTFACPAKYEYGEALRSSLQRIEKEG